MTSTERTSLLGASTGHSTYSDSVEAPPVAPTQMDAPAYMNWLVSERNAKLNAPKSHDVEPKVFFSNERTFLDWLNTSVTLAAIAMAVIAFSEENDGVSKLFGLILMPIAIAFCAYSVWMYMKRCYLLRNHIPGPFEDLFGPVLLTVILMIAIVANFFIKIITLATHA